MIPIFKQEKSLDALQNFSTQYYKSSGLPIPEEYMTNTQNKVFSIYWQKDLVGGFILGREKKFRTISFFAKPENQIKVYQSMNNSSQYTEICCFWIARQHRTNTFINFFIWFAMTYALRFYGSKYFLFGTCSKSLARLYAQTAKSKLIHEDKVNNKSTFIFQAKRSGCVLGMLEIIHHKLKRILRNNKNRAKQLSNA